MAEQVVRVENNPLIVSGTVTSTPSGTQDVAITGQPISVTSSPSVPVVVQPASSFGSGYIFSVSNQAGVVAANNFLSLFNPVGSGKILALGGAFVSVVATAAATSPEPMRGFRITAASAGTLQADSAVAKLKTSQDDPVAEVRIGNPTVTLGAALFNVPPAITASGGSGGFTQDVQLPPNSPAFHLVEGEGVVLRTAAGDVDQSWNMTLTWAEI
jgi:hypothetical protein